MNIADLRWGEDGLIPVVVQDELTKDVLTLAYMSEESLKKTLDTKETWFWSRSRQELWHKGRRQATCNLSETCAMIVTQIVSSFS